MAGCVTGKKMFPSMETAEDALINAWVRFSYPDGAGPVNVYRCDDCGHFHLTSSGEMNARLSQYLKEGKIERQRDAAFWEKKLKKR